MKRLTLTLMALSLSTSALFAYPSWCKGGARTVVEHFICTKRYLWSYDEDLTAVYKSLKRKLYGSEKRALILSEREWIRSRNRCRSEECVARHYRNRLRYLINYYDDVVSRY